MPVGSSGLSGAPVGARLAGSAGTANRLVRRPRGSPRQRPPPTPQAAASRARGL
jgi:hypothetical protein